MTLHTRTRLVRLRRRFALMILLALALFMILIYTGVMIYNRTSVSADINALNNHYAYEILQREVFHLLNAIRDNLHIPQNIERHMIAIDTYLLSVSRAEQPPLDGLNAQLQDVLQRWDDTRHLLVEWLDDPLQTSEAALIQEQLMRLEEQVNVVSGMYATARSDLMWEQRFVSEQLVRLVALASAAFIIFVLLVLWNAYNLIRQVMLADERLFLLNRELDQRVRERTSQLTFEQARMQVILDSIGEGLIYDENLVTRYVNPALVAETGYTLDEWEGFLDILRPATMPIEAWRAQARVIYDAVNRTGSWEGEITVSRKDGTLFDAAVVCNAVRLPDGTINGAVTLLRDVSAAKKLKDQQARFVAMAAHELRNPIASLKNRVYLLKRDTANTDYHVRLIDRVVERLHRLVEDMLDLNRFENGMVQVRKTSVDLCELIHEVLEMEAFYAQEHSVELVEEMPEKLCPIQADANRLRQVLMNLVINAIHHTPTGGRVGIRVEADAGQVHICVWDTGVGISPEALPRLFEPFYRGENATIPGMGLGLSISAEIIRLHGGTISVESKQGEGSAFTVSLALEPASAS